MRRWPRGGRCASGTTARRQPRAPGCLWRPRRAQWCADRQEVGSAGCSSFSIVTVARTAGALSQTRHCQANLKADQGLKALRTCLNADLAPRNAELIQQLQLPPELRAGDLAAQQLAVSRNSLRRLVGGFVQELDPEMPHAQGQHARDIIRARLGQRIEDGVAAAGIRLDRVLRAHAVAQLQIVLVAGPAAVRVVRAAGEKSAEDAMLHVKHGHMLVNGDLEPLRRRSLQKRLKLCEVQIVGGREALPAELVLEIISRKPVGDVERIVANAAVVREEAQMVVVADEVPIRLAGSDLLERPLLAHLEYPRRRDEAFGLGSAERRVVEASDRLAILLWVLEFTVERRYAALQCGVELRLLAHQHD